MLTKKQKVDTQEEKAYYELKSFLEDVFSESYTDFDITLPSQSIDEKFEEFEVTMVMEGVNIILTFKVENEKVYILHSEYHSNLYMRSAPESYIDITETSEKYIYREIIYKLVNSI